MVRLATNSELWRSTTKLQAPPRFTIALEKLSSSLDQAEPTLFSGCYGNSPGLRRGVTSGSSWGESATRETHRIARLATSSSSISSASSAVGCSLMAFSAGLSGEKRGDAPRATTGDATAWTTCGSARGGLPAASRGYTQARGPPQRERPGGPPARGGQACQKNWVGLTRQPAVPLVAVDRDSPPSPSA